jgi:nicotinamide-nucleotide amidase
MNAAASRQSNWGVCRGTRPEGRDCGVCTGGPVVAAAITDVAGSSGWFDCGLVTYSNAAKVTLLGVRAETIAVHGAVSEAVAREMAVGALANSAADLTVAITGIAGPSGGTPDKPVGTVCFGWARRGGAADAGTRHFDGDRGRVRQAAVAAALEGLLARAAASS